MTTMTHNASGEPVVRKKKKRPPMFVYLAYGLLATMLFVGVTFSGYATTANSLDGARVAKFEITEKDLTQVADIELEITPYEPGIFKFAVENKSEVDVSYTVTVAELTDNVPLTFKLNGMELIYDETANIHTYTKTCEANENSTYQLEMLLSRNDLSYMGMVEHIQVTVSAVQID